MSPLLEKNGDFSLIQAIPGQEIQKDWESFLAPDHWRYIRDSPSKGYKLYWNGEKRTRNQIEESIIWRLVYHGASDRQIIDLADRWQLRRHIEAKPRGGNSYIQRSIDRVRVWGFTEKGLLTSPKGHAHRRATARRQTTDQKLTEALELVRGQKQSEWVKELQDSLGKSQASAYRIKDRLQARGLVRIENRRVLSSVDES